MKKYLLFLLLLVLLNPSFSFSFSTLKVDTTTHLFKARSYLKNLIGFGIGGNIISNRLRGVRYDFKQYKSDLVLGNEFLPPEGLNFIIKKNEYVPLVSYMDENYYLFGIVNPYLFISFKKKNKVKSVLTMNWDRINNKPYQSSFKIAKASLSKYFVQYSLGYQRYYQIINFHSKNNNNGIFLNPSLSFCMLTDKDRNTYYYDWGVYELKERLLSSKKVNAGLQISVIKAFRKNSQAIEFGFLIPIFDYYNMKITGTNYIFSNNSNLGIEKLGSYTYKGIRLFHIKETMINSYLFKLNIKYHIIWNKKSKLQ